MTELQAYIEFELSEGEYERTRQLYERLLDRTKNLKVWIIYAKFESSATLEEESRAAEEDRLPDPEILEEQNQQRVLRTRGL